MCASMDSVRLATPNPANATPRTDLTLRILVLSDLAAGATQSGPPKVVDANGIDQLMNELEPRVKISVTDHIGLGRPPELDVVLEPRSLEDLAPDGLVSTIAPLRRVLDARAAIGRCLAGETPLEELLDALAEALGDGPLASSLKEAMAAAGGQGSAEPTAASAASDPVASILDKVDVPGPAASSSVPAATTSSLVDAIAQVVAPATTTGADRQRLEPLLEDIDRRLTRQVDAVLAHPAVQELERAWRSLAFLLRRTLRTPARIEVLAGPTGEALDLFFDRVFHQEHEQSSDIPLTAVLFDRPFGRSPAEVSELQAAGRLGDSLGVPFIASMASEFFGMKQHRRLATLPDLTGKVTGPEYAKWRAFRSDPLSLWVCLTVNRFLLREAWGSRTDRVRSFRWTGSDGSPLWGEGSWALVTAVLTSFAEEGLKFLCIGPRSPGALNDLPLTTYTTGKDEPVQFPLEVRLTDQTAYDLRHLGFAPLMARSGSDSAYFTAAPTVHAPARYDSDEATHASFRAATLPFQLFAGIVAHLVQRIGQEIPAGMTAQELQDAFQGPLLSLLATTEPDPQPEEVDIETSDHEDDPGVIDVTVRLRPSFPLYGGEVDLIAGTIVPR